MFFFSKMQATGNDFIVINYLENKLEYSYRLLAKFLCDRHFGVGADGVLIVEESKVSDFKMRIFNQDGTEAEMCGNGIRCFAKYLYEKKITDKKEINIETLGGIKKVKLDVEGNTVIKVSVDMGEPIFDFEKIPVIYQEDDLGGKIHIENFEIYPVSLGNPHAVCFVDNLKEFDIQRYGKMIEEYKYFPNKTNVEFVEIVDNKNIKMRVWERGVGETLACGTGACASGVIANKYKSTESKLIVDLLGGKLEVENSNNIILKGESEFVFEGKIEI